MSKITRYTKVLRKLKLVIFIGILCVGKTNSQNTEVNQNDYLIKAITQCAHHYFEAEKPDKFQVYVVKIVSMKQNKGEFSMSYIYSVNNEDLRVSHYMHVDDKLFFIVTDQLHDEFELQSNCNRINNSIMHVANNITHGLRPDYPDKDMVNVAKVGITAQAPPVMVCKYNRNRLLYEFYWNRSLIDRKYLYYYREEDKE